ncbi:DUF2982 domain-containing protein [Pseudoalteromonas sp. SG45-5]|jgi:hypothetical protein|uniref:DUF2982 domain-containing protein n=1 Tax=Pseudoalteromonas aliena SW19 TaxID=1314866 RepID=A0ABR9E099_9GAMM|nr:MULTISPECIES: DUF2982 domain-containing protein [Pseudoalteromonas]MBB1385113.1 DUF2982 domain-containing protein [Pseudoalteromonas sp. SG45-5]MBB1392988.1 DUF2982 domain-containing protein [Pseudoalteromonas sp. SG44-4]MBB1447743.1 DUF2982 domain-containing protein [Pseudoalteromonas sp. SG41-6]MBE0359970.1 hypothetical protein [Pseudoalteromonas aliena SW19]
MGKNNIKYRAQGTRNGIEILIVGAVGLAFIMAFNLLRPGEISILEIFLVSVCLVAIFVGFLKTQEPFYSLVLDEATLVYNHKYGSWRLPHANFHHSGIPKVKDSFEYIELNAVGVKVNDIDEFLADIAPRIAGKLLIEQRYLFMQAVQKHCKNGNCPSEWLIEDTQYKSQKGICYNGLIAMFANRAKFLQLLTGYDLLLPASVLDRDVWDFSANLNKWKHQPSQFIASQVRD